MLSVVKLLNKQSSSLWFTAQWRSKWHHCNEIFQSVGSMSNRCGSKGLCYMTEQVNSNEIFILSVLLIMVRGIMINQSTNGTIISDFRTWYSPIGGLRVTAGIPVELAPDILITVSLMLEFTSCVVQSSIGDTVATVWAIMSVKSVLISNISVFQCSRTVNVATVVGIGYVLSLLRVTDAVLDGCMALTDTSPTVSIGL